MLCPTHKIRHSLAFIKWSHFLRCSDLTNNLSMDNFRANHMNLGDQVFYNKNHQEEEEEERVANTGCFGRLSCFKWWRNNKTDYQFLLNHRGEERKESWFEQKLKRVKEASELLAGPKWKNFFRKLGGYFGESNKCKTKGFQYDSQSYALNFDDLGHEDSGRLFAGFSARFAPPLNHNHPASAF